MLTSSRLDAWNKRAVVATVTDQSVARPFQDRERGAEQAPPLRSALQQRFDGALLADGIRRVALGSQDGLTGALLSHNVDGIIGGTQTGYRLEQEGKGKILTTFGPLIPDFIARGDLSAAG